MTAAAPGLTTLRSGGAVSVRLREGTGGTLVVSLAGRGRHGDNFQRPVNEFYRLAQGDGTNHVLFVQDHARTWMNGPGLAEAIVGAVDEARARTAATRVVALGNSMGGTMALILARLMQLDGIVALAPQFSVDPRIVPGETRWTADRQRIAHFRFPSVGALPEGQAGVTILHGSTADELLHARLFPAMDGVGHWILPGLGHDLAARLHGGGRLAAVLRPALAGRPRRTRRAVEALGGIARRDLEPGPGNGLRARVPAE